MTRIGLAVASVGLAAALTACGGGEEDFTEQSADKIAEESKAAMSGLDAVKVTGDISSDGQEISIDMQVNSDGKCIGSIGVGDGTADLMGVDGEAWFKPDEAFWQATAGDSTAEILAIVGDKWVVVPPGDDGFAQFCDLDGMLESMLEDSDEDDKATFTVGDTEEIDGKDAVAVKREDDEGTSTGWVLTDEPHWLVKIEKTEGEDTGTITFSEFDQEFDVAAPEESDVVDLDSVGG
jgi:hypothetical protein